MTAFGFRHRIRSMAEPKHFWNIKTPYAKTFIVVV